MVQEMGRWSGLLFAWGEGRVDGSMRSPLQMSRGIWRFARDPCLYVSQEGARAQ
jgi:hypothetical protein